MRGNDVLRVAQRQAAPAQLPLGAALIEVSAPQTARLAVAGGSPLPGVGIVLAGGCATGTYYRSGEGLIGSWIALIFYALLASVMKYGALQSFNDAARADRSELTTIHASLGISPWILVGLLAAVVAWAITRQRSQRVATLPAKPGRSALVHRLVGKPWSPYATAITVGVLAAIAYPLSNATGRAAGMGITTPSANIVQFLTTGDAALVDWGVLFVLGLIPGSFIAAKLSGEFKLRVPDASTTVRAIGGGSAMGIGAALAGGCTIGNSLVQTALFSYQGWVAFVFTLLGVGIGARYFIQTHRRAGAAPVAVPQRVSASR